MDHLSLFGGAISCHIPHNYRDVSNLRVVPDNQEVYVEGATDASFIIEILERADVADEVVARHLFMDLIEYEEAAVDPLSVHRVELPLGAPSAEHNGVKSFADAVCGVAAIAKFKEAARNQVLILAAVVRLPTVNTDLLITWNLPLYISPASSSAGSATASASVQPIDREGRAPFEARACALLQDAVLSLAIHNWALFQGGAVEEG